MPAPTLGAEISGALTMIRAMATAAGRPPSRAPISGVGIPGVEHIIAVASGKGGVGKSTTAVNLAVAMSQRLGLRVGVLDADVHGPSLPRLLNLPGRPAVDADEMMVPLMGHGLKAISMGNLMAEDAAAVWRGPMVMSALNSFISRVRWGPLDVLLLDMPPGTGDAQLTVSQRLALSGAVVVTTPQDLALIDARRGVTMFRQVGVPVLGLVENMSWFVCGGCGAEAHVFGSGGAARAGAEMGLEVLGQIPLNIAIRETSDAGAPIVASQPDSAAAAAYVSVAERVWAKLQELDRRKEAEKRGPPRVVVE